MNGISIYFTRFGTTTLMHWL